jgi:hypothetical protein
MPPTTSFDAGHLAREGTNQPPQSQCVP